MTGNEKWILCNSLEQAKWTITNTKGWFSFKQLIKTSITVLDQLEVAIVKKKHTKLVKRNDIIFHQPNAKTHSLITKQKLLVCLGRFHSGIIRYFNFRLVSIPVFAESS